MQHDEEAPLIQRLAAAQVGACTCVTKTNEVHHHSPTCSYRLFVEAEWECIELEDAYSLVMRQGALLTGAVNILRGTPPDLTHWSHHDVADLAQLYRDVYVAAVMLVTKSKTKSPYVGALSSSLLALAVTLKTDRAELDAANTAMDAANNKEQAHDQ